jgi:hypothetical protein
LGRVGGGIANDTVAEKSGRSAETFTRNSNPTANARRSIECIIESIPSSILQTVAFFKSGGKAKSALFTAFISSVTTGFTMSSIAYDFDTSPTKRKENSYFYGYIPDNANDRMIAFFCLFVACTTHCGWRIFSSSLLIMVDWRYFVGWITGEVSRRRRRKEEGGEEEEEEEAEEVRLC